MGFVSLLCELRTDHSAGYYPRLILLLPNIIVLTVIVMAHPPHTSSESASSITEEIRSPPRHSVREGSAEWLANIHGIQNLMGLMYVTTSTTYPGRVNEMPSSADIYDTVIPLVRHLTFATHHTPHIFTATLLITLLALPFLSLIPLRPIFLVCGLAPFAFTHPFVQHALAQLFQTLPLHRWRARFTRLIDDDRLKDHHWQSSLREVELFENERWGPGEGIGWSKANLKSGERVAWTRGRDGWSAVTADGSGSVRSVLRPSLLPLVSSSIVGSGAASSHGYSSNLTFLLEPGWVFVETEDWRADSEAKWSEVGADECERFFRDRYVISSARSCFCDIPSGMGVYE